MLANGRWDLTRPLKVYQRHTKIKLIDCPSTSVRNYHSTLRKIKKKKKRAEVIKTQEKTKKQKKTKKKKIFF